MCGIVGIAGADAGSIDRGSVHAMSAVLTHRGPDDEGFYFGDRVGLGMRRLAIIDLAGGHQPVPNEDGSMWVVFNGEIYNYREVRKNLEARGHRLATRSDTECLVHLYEDFGDDCVHHLRGMFAFALWDDRRKRLLLARDRCGIKPLYYCHYRGGIAFGSEIKALLALPGVERTVNVEALSAFFSLGYVPGPATIYQGIRELPPAHRAVWSSAGLQLTRYWEARPTPDHGKPLGFFTEQLRGLLDESVQLHLESDVQLGAFLSGGLDSSAIVALMARRSERNVKTLTVGFTTEERRFDERPFARSVADAFDTDHSECLMSPDVESVLPAIIRALDEPFADSSMIPTFIVCQAAREWVKVVLSGLGGDELFAGYERYRGALLAEYYRRLPGGLRRGLLDPAIAAMPESRNGNPWRSRLKRFVEGAGLDLPARYQAYVTAYGHAEQSELFTHDLVLQLDRGGAGGAPPLIAADDSGLDPLDRMLLADFNSYLPYDLLRMTDRLSMCHSIEVRVPFLDHKLIEFVATIPARFKVGAAWKKKYVLTRSLESVVPPEVLRRRKQGFSVPLNTWLRGPLRDFVQTHLSETKLRAAGFFNAGTVARIVKEHDTRVKDHETRIWTLLTFMMWHDMYIAERPRPVPTRPELASAAGVP